MKPRSFSLRSLILLLFVGFFGSCTKESLCATPSELEKYLTQREKVQSAEEMEEHFPTATKAGPKPIENNQEYQTYFRLSVAGKEKQLWDRALILSLLAGSTIAYRARGIFRKK